MEGEGKGKTEGKRSRRRMGPDVRQDRKGKVVVVLGGGKRSGSRSGGGGGSGSGGKGGRGEGESEVLGGVARIAVGAAKDWVGEGGCCELGACGGLLIKYFVIDIRHITMVIVSAVLLLEDRRVSADAFWESGFQLTRSRRGSAKGHNIVVALVTVSADRFRHGDLLAVMKQVVG